MVTKTNYLLVAVISITTTTTSGIIISSSSSTAASTASTFHPYLPGPHNSTHIHISALVTLGLNEELEVWAPTDEGSYPVLFLIDGFGGVIPAMAYNEVCHHLASHGVAVVAPWSVTLPLNPVDKVPIFSSVLDWADAHLEDKLHAKGLDQGVHLDLSNTILSGHSAGAHVLVEYLKAGCGQVRGQVFLSPVDGVDPLGLIPEFCITPGEYLNYGVPTLHLMTGFDNVPASSGLACAPDDLSNMRFYNALDPAVAPLWHINTTCYGHMDILDQYYLEVGTDLGFCGYNPDLSLDEHEVYRAFVGGTVASFIKAVFTEEEEECKGYLSYLEDPTLMTVQVTSRYDNPTGRCPTPTCTWSPLPATTTATATNTTLTT